MLSNKLKLFLIAGLLSLSGCSGMTQSNAPAMTSWWLEPFTSSQQGQGTAAIEKVLLSISVAPGLDTNRVLTLSQDAELKPYSSARWADNLPELMTSLVGQSLQRSGRFELVRGASEADCELALKVQKFFAVQRQGSVSVEVALSGEYRCDSRGLTRVDVGVGSIVEGQQMKAVVAGFQRSFDDAMKSLLGRLP